MSEESYWRRTEKARFSRRRLVEAAAAGGLVLAGGSLIACGAQGKRPATGAGSAGAPQTGAGQAQPGGTYNTFIGYDAIMDAQKSSNASQRTVWPVMSRLLMFKVSSDAHTTTNHELENDLATSFESPDAITYTFKLNPVAKFHDVAPVNGHAVEAEDIKATFARALDPKTSNPNAGNLSMIDVSQIQTPDKQTVVFKLKYQYAVFPHLMANPYYSLIYPREVLSGAYDPARTAIGSGPFILDKYEPSVAYTYRKNPDYHLKPYPYVDTLRQAVVSDQQTQFAQFTAGNLDELPLTAVLNFDSFRQQNPKADYFKVYGAGPSPMYFQLGDSTGPCYDVRVRRALSMVIDREAINKAQYNGNGANPLFIGQIFGKWSLDASQLAKDSQQYYQYNPGEAKKLLEAAGYPNPTFRMGYITNGPFTATYTKQAEIVVGMLNAAGIKANLFQQDYQKDFIDSGKGSRQGYFDKDVIIFAGVASGTDPDDTFYNNMYSTSSSNAERLNDPALDKMIDDERKLVNDDDRLKAILEIERYVADKMYVVPTPGTNSFFFLQPRVQNYQYSNADIGTETWMRLWLKQ